MTCDALSIMTVVYEQKNKTVRACDSCAILPAVTDRTIILITKLKNYCTGQAINPLTTTPR